MHLVFKINQPVNVVFDYLTDMQKFVSVHPVITRIDNISGINYLVHETLKILLIPFSFKYKVTVEQNFSAKKVLISATVMKKTNIVMSYVLHPEGKMTVINETIIVKSPFPIKSIVEKIFRKQHSSLFKNIDAVKL